jgi:DHA1 family bicyclomycin/chloramphenicol resistance-like MFS transporter
MLKQFRLVMLIAFLSMFIPLSMDMYLPALPQMIDFFDSNEIIVNSTLYVFYLFMAAGMLIFGPLSDKCGRKHILIPCIVVYCLASVCCAFSSTIVTLVISRIFQALSVGALVVVSTAIIKDAFHGRQREAILGISQAMSLVAPVVAPVLGAFILQFFPWQANFIVLALFGVLAFILALIQPETLLKEDRLMTGAFAAWLHLGTVLQNKGFIWFMVVSSIAPIGYMAYISSSSYIYQNSFFLTEMQFGAFYSINAIVTVAASLAYIKISVLIKPKMLIQLILGMIFLTGVLLIAVGSFSPSVFLLSFLPCAFACTTLKPLSTSVLLRQQESGAGSASSLLNFTQTIFSFFGLILGSIPWSNMILGLGGIVICACTVALFGWVILLRLRNVHIAAFVESKTSN